MVLSHSKPRWPRRIIRTSAIISGAALVSLVAAACSTGSSTSATGSYGFTEAKQVKNSTITVWVDATRLPAAQAFEKAYPNTKIKIVTYDGAANGSNSFQTKMQLFDRAKKGWPDVVWSTQDNDSAWASQASAGEQPFAAQLNKGLVSSATLAGFAKGALDPCTINGKVYCLRNDLASNVLWYNKALMDQFGYKIPTTWEQYEALGVKVAKDHPGYIIGAAGDSWTPEIYMWASKCQANDVTAIRSVTVNTTSADEHRQQVDHDRQRLQPVVPEELHRQGPHDARPGLVQRSDLRQRDEPQRSRGTDRCCGAARVLGRDGGHR
jgi:ABC-type glycerol-3-phosphate transport system substrate-binding protein